MKTSIIGLGKDTLIYGLGNIATRFISLILLPFYTQFLNPREYGILAMLSILSFFGQQVFSFGLGASLGIEYFKRENIAEKKRVIYNAATLLLGSSLLFLFINFIFSSQLSTILFSDSENQFFIKINSISIFLQILSVPFSSHLQFQKKSKLYSLISISTLLVSIGSSLIFVIMFKLSALGILYSAILSQAVSLLLLIYYFNGDLLLRPSWISMRAIFKNGLPLIPSFIILFLLAQSNRFFVKSVGGIDIVGIYSIGSNLGMVMSVFVGSFTTAWFPYFMSFITKQNELKSEIKTIATFYVLIFGLLTILFFVFSRPIVFLLAESYKNSFCVIGFIAFSQILLGFHTLLLPPLYFSNSVKAVNYVQFLTAILSILVNYYFINTKNPLLGAGLSMFFTYFLLCLFQYLWNNYDKKNIIYPFEWKYIGLMFSFILIIGILTLVFPLSNFFIELTVSISFLLILLLGFYFFIYLKKGNNFLIIFNNILNKTK